jgi:hypothetical protein
LIVINKDSENKLVLTLSQDAGVNYTYYLFVFSSLHMAQDVKFLAQDTSTHPERYNLITVTEMADPDTLDAEAYFRNTGDYKYQVYGKYTQDLDVPIGLPLETGFARVQGINYTYDSTNSNYNTIGYDPSAE